MCDKYVNNYGHRLVQLCRNMDIHIPNGRVGKDRYIGSLTCRDTSTVDYLIVSSQVFPCAYDFFIDHFNALLSDCNRALCNKVCTPAKQPNTCDLSGFVKNGFNLSKRPNWKPEHSLRFCSKIDEYKLELIQRELHKMSNNIKKNGINYITDSICDLLTDSAKQIGCFRATNRSNVTINSINNKKPWFTQ